MPWTLYQAMSKYVSDEPYHRASGALWFVQLWLFAYFQKLSDKELTSFKSLRLYVVHSLSTMPSDDLVSFFLGLVDQALVQLFLKPDFIYIAAWNQSPTSFHPYMHDFESSMVSASATCKVLISGGCFAFYSSLSISPGSLHPYLPCL